MRVSSGFTYLPSMTSLPESFCGISHDTTTHRFLDELQDSLGHRFPPFPADLFEPSFEFIGNFGEFECSHEVMVTSTSRDFNIKTEKELLGQIHPTIFSGES